MPKVKTTLGAGSLSPQEMEERFALLATDAKEYAVFLVGLDRHILCWLFVRRSHRAALLSLFYARSDSRRRDRASLLSHELRSPLSPIINALNILRQMKTSDPIIEQAGNVIDRQVGVMVRLVDDLLDVSRITKGKLRLTTERVDLRVVVNHAVETVRPLMEARTHDFSVSIPTDSIWVGADPVRMEQRAIP